MSSASRREARPANVVTDAQVEREDRMEGSEESSAVARVMLGPLRPKGKGCRRWSCWVWVWVLLGAATVAVLAAAMVPTTGRTATVLEMIFPRAGQRRGDGLRTAVGVDPETGQVLTSHDIPLVLRVPGGVAIKGVATVQGVSVASNVTLSGPLVFRRPDGSTRRVAGLPQVLTAELLGAVQAHCDIRLCNSPFGACALEQNAQTGRIVAVGCECLPWARFEGKDCRFCQTDDAVVCGGRGTASAPSGSAVLCGWEGPGAACDCQGNWEGDFCDTCSPYRAFNASLPESSACGACQACVGDPCGPGGTCVELPQCAGFQCQCSANFTGPSCSSCADARFGGANCTECKLCETLGPLNCAHGTCVPNADCSDVTCQRDEGTWWYGPDLSACSPFVEHQANCSGQCQICEKWANTSASPAYLSSGHPCSGHGTCVSDNTTCTGYTCTCDTGYLQPWCGRNSTYTECTGLCLNGGTCNSGTDECDCVNGWEGATCSQCPWPKRVTPAGKCAACSICDDLGGAGAPCGSPGTNTTVQQGSCALPAGFVENVGGNCSVQDWFQRCQCTDEWSGFNCTQCKWPWAVTPSVQEETDSPLTCAGCVPTLAAQCRPDQGTLVLRQSPSTPATRPSFPYVVQTQCVAPSLGDGPWRCNCSDYWSGFGCQSCEAPAYLLGKDCVGCDLCANNTCSGHGTCTTPTGSCRPGDAGVCECDDGWSGPDCSLCAAPWQETTNTFPNGTTTQACNTCRNTSCSSDACMNGGTCELDPAGGCTRVRCTCTGDNFAGQYCERCAPGHWGPSCEPCDCPGAHQVCADERTGTGACSCLPGWSGYQCGIPQCGALARWDGTACACDAGLQLRGDAGVHPGNATDACASPSLSECAFAQPRPYTWPACRSPVLVLAWPGGSQVLELGRVSAGGEATVVRLLVANTTLLRGSEGPTTVQVGRGMGAVAHLWSQQAAMELSVQVLEQGGQGAASLGTLPSAPLSLSTIFGPGLSLCVEASPLRCLVVVRDRVGDPEFSGRPLTADQAQGAAAVAVG